MVTRTRKPVQKLQTPQEFLIELYAEILYNRENMKQSRGFLTGAIFSLKTYDELLPRERYGYKKAARAEINNLLMPMISFHIEEVVEEAEEDPFAMAGQERNDPPTPEMIDAIQTEKLEDADFYGAKTEIFA